MGLGASASIDREAEKRGVKSAPKHDAREGYTPKSAEASLVSENRHYDLALGSDGKLALVEGHLAHKTDAQRFNELFADAVREYNAEKLRKYSKPAPANYKGETVDVIDPETGEAVAYKLLKKAADQMIPVGDDGVPLYYEHIKELNRGKESQQQKNTFDEYVFGIGSRDEGGITDADFDADIWRAKRERDRQTGGTEAAEYVAAHRTPERVAELDKQRAALELVRERFPERFPAIKMLRFDINMDEPDGHPHAHAVIVPCVERDDEIKSGRKRRDNGPRLQCSFDKALKKMGYKDNAVSGWKATEQFRRDVQQLIYECGVEVGLEMEHKGQNGRKRLSKEAFHELREAQKEAAALVKAAEDERMRALHGYIPAVDEDGNEARLVMHRTPDTASLDEARREMGRMFPVGATREQDGRRLTVDGAYVPGSLILARDAALTVEEAKGDAESLRQRALLDAETEEAYLAHAAEREARNVEAELTAKRERSANLGREIAARNDTLAELNVKIREKREADEQFNRETRSKRRNLADREARVKEAEQKNAEAAKKNERDAAENAAREKRLREGIAALKFAQETIANPTVTIEGEDADTYTARVVERTVLATADVFMRSTSPHEDVQRERRQLGSDLYAEADMAASMGTRMRLDDGSEGTLFSLVRDRVRAFMREPMGTIARAVDAVSARVRDYLAQAEAALDFSSTFADLDDEATGKPRTAKQRAQTTARTVQQQRLTFAELHHVDLDSVDSTPSTDDYGPDF